MTHRWLQEMSGTARLQCAVMHCTAWAPASHAGQGPSCASRQPPHIAKRHVDETSNSTPPDHSPPQRDSIGKLRHCPPRPQSSTTQGSPVGPNDCLALATVTDIVSESRGSSLAAAGNTTIRPVCRKLTATTPLIGSWHCSQYCCANSMH